MCLCVCVSQTAHAKMLFIFGNGRLMRYGNRDVCAIVASMTTTVPTMMMIVLTSTTTTTTGHM